LILLLGYDPTLKSYPSRSGCTHSIALNTSGGGAGDHQYYINIAASEKSEGETAYLVYAAYAPGETTRFVVKNPPDQDAFVTSVVNGSYIGQIWRTPLFIEKSADENAGIPALGNILFARAVSGAGEPLGIAMRIAPETNPIYLWFTAETGTDPVELTLQVEHLPTAAKVLDYKAKANMTGRTGWVALSTPKGVWEPGWHKATVTYAGQEKHEDFFLVARE